MNPYIISKRPFYVTSFDKRTGSIWGNGLPALLRDLQRVANASARALVKNMALASGPIGEVDVGRLASEEDVTEIEPYRIYSVDADPIIQHNMPAFRFFKIDSNAAELMAVYEKFMKEADDISGVPSYVLGNPQVAGAGRTLGGLSLLMGNAAKGIKKVISQIDKDVVEPLIEAYNYMNLAYHPDESIKFDSSVVARGSSGLLQKELSQARAVDVIQTLMPLVQSGDVPRESLHVVLRDVVRGLGYNPDEIIPDPRRKAVVNDYLNSGVAQPTGLPPGVVAPPPAGAQPPSQAGSNASVPPVPNLDSRSQPALDAQATGV
jgi:hypothetical protein